MKQIFSTIYGSFLYGTNIENSDKDYKGIFLPSAEQILNGEIPSSYSNNTNKDSKRKNTKDDIDCQLFSLKKFLHDLVSGQTYTYELLFAPKNLWKEPIDPVWLELLANKNKLISSNVTAMVGYARAQAYKYGEKGKRLEVFKDVIDCFQQWNPVNKLVYFYDADLKKLIEKHSQFISIHRKDNDSSGVEYLDVNGVMVPLGSTVQYALDVYKPRLEEYGSRAKQAMENKGNDLKAIYHSIRIANQAEELLMTGNITLPRPESPMLLDVRKGLLSEKQMKDLIDGSFERVRQAEKKSALQPNPDKKWMKEFLMQTHLDVVVKEKNLYKGWSKIPTYEDYVDYDNIRI